MKTIKTICLTAIVILQLTTPCFSQAPQKQCNNVRLITVSNPAAIGMVRHATVCNKAASKANGAATTTNKKENESSGGIISDVTVSYNENNNDQNNFSNGSHLSVANTTEQYESKAFDFRKPVNQ